jgi:hypothetical protein
MVPFTSPMIVLVLAAASAHLTVVPERWYSP